MRISFVILSALLTLSVPTSHVHLFFGAFPTLAGAETVQVPLPPNTANASLQNPASDPLALYGESFSEIRTPDPSDYPVRLMIPSINLDSPIQDVGLTALGEMDVPDGATNNVGWYKYGTLPGEWGDAVLDAHVYAAFKNLRYLKVGSDVYVQTVGGTIHHFVVTDSRVYALDEIPMQDIFTGDGKGLNFITCARKFSRTLNTYTHRLVVYTQLVE